MRTEDELRKALSQAAQQAATPATNARAAVGRRVRRQRAVRLGAVGGVALAIAVFAILSVTRPDHHASVRVVSPGPSPSSAPGPAPDTATSPTTSPAEVVPAGFSALSVTFVSPNDGFVLGSAPCATPPCTVILRTNDTGKTWHRIGAPRAAVSEPGGSGEVSIRAIRFATANDGWAFGPDLWSTHDAGRHWTKVAHEGDVYDLEAAAGRAHMIVLGPVGDQYAYRIWSTPVATDSWVVAPVTLPKGPAGVASAQIVLQGHAGWALVDDRVVYDGARLGPSGWTKWVPPCMDAFGAATLLAPTAEALNAVCAEGTWGGDRPPGVGLYTSNDGGSTFARAAKNVPSANIEAASGNPDTIVVVGSAKVGGAVLWATFDRGATWSIVHRGGVSELGFTTPTQGIGLDVGADGRATRFVLSTDGGHQWQATPFD